MTTVHKPLTWFAGDDWEIRATLIDEAGQPYDLSGSHTIKWALVDSAHHKVLDETAADITIVDGPAGKCRILIPADKTTKLLAGHYQDAIRIVIGGITSTLSTGPMFVAADPWLAAAVAKLRQVA
jgi:hypothetical protein